ncbi:MAG: hypothetical protein U0264_01670 [Candidatus Kapaibacterium sp.]|jgi:hypothetical protein
MDNNNYNYSNSPAGLLGFLFGWVYVAFANLLAFTDTVTLDDVQKFFAILTSIVVAVVTILTFLRNQKKKK